FDWRLIWIIDYSDILKFGLVALGVLSGLLVLLGWLLFRFVELSLLEEEGKRSRRIFFGLLSIAGIAIFLVVQWLFGPIPLSLVTTMIASWSVLVALCITVTRLLTQRDTVDASALIVSAALVVATVAGFGLALGSFTKHFPNWLHYDVFLKGGNMTD